MVYNGVITNILVSADKTKKMVISCKNILSYFADNYVLAKFKFKIYLILEK